jgi:hypothetical protein
MRTRQVYLDEGEHSPADHHIRNRPGQRKPAMTESTFETPASRAVVATGRVSAQHERRKPWHRPISDHRHRVEALGTAGGAVTVLVWC